MSGRGNDVQLAAIAALEPVLVGGAAELGELPRMLIHDSQLRWLGTERGVMHMTIGPVLNALWDREAKQAGNRFNNCSQLSPDDLVDLVDFRYPSDVLTPAQALDILRAAEPGRARRAEQLIAEGDTVGPDSRGLFQQRAAGWGTYAQTRTPQADAGRPERTSFVSSSAPSRDLTDHSDDQPVVHVRHDLPLAKRPRSHASAGGRGVPYRLPATAEP